MTWLAIKDPNRGRLTLVNLSNVSIVSYGKDGGLGKVTLHGKQEVLVEFWVSEKQLDRIVAKILRKVGKKSWKERIFGEEVIEVEGISSRFEDYIILDHMAGALEEFRKEGFEVIDRGVNRVLMGKRLPQDGVALASIETFLGKVVAKLVILNRKEFEAIKKFAGWEDEDE